MTVSKKTGQLIKSARLKTGFTQVELAKKAGIHPNTYAKVERGEQEATFATLKKIVKALNLDLTDF